MAEKPVSNLIAQKVAAVFSACPYTIMGKKLFSRKHVLHTRDLNSISPREIQIANKIKLGRNIALIGFFCPFFWFSLFSGAKPDFILFNAVHSGIVIAIGLLVLVKGKLDLNRYRNTRKGEIALAGRIVSGSKRSN